MTSMGETCTNLIAEAEWGSRTEVCFSGGVSLAPWPEAQQAERMGLGGVCAADGWAQTAPRITDDPGRSVQPAGGPRLPQSLARMPILPSCPGPGRPRCAMYARRGRASWPQSAPLAPGLNTDTGCGHRARADMGDPGRACGSVQPAGEPNHSEGDGEGHRTSIPIVPRPCYLRPKATPHHPIGVARPAPDRLGMVAMQAPTSADFGTKSMGRAAERPRPHLDCATKGPSFLVL